MKREFDVVLYGASGFTGRQTVQYFTEHAPAGLRWAIAGRDRTKLEALNARVPVFVASCDDQALIDRFVSATRVVLSTAGPFTLYGTGIVDACVRFGTHYTDITGETLWVRQMIDFLEQTASTKNVRIIPFCGFDSIPSDLGAAWMMHHLPGVTEIRAYFELKGGQLNGGTVATGLNAMESGDSRAMRNLFLLSPQVKREALKMEADPTSAFFDTSIGAWAAPFIMSSINTRVVRRSFALQGIDVAYQEYMKPGGRVLAYAVAMLDWVSNAGTEHAWVRNLLRRAAPAPGSGPTEATMNSGWFRCTFVGKTADGRTARALMEGTGDPANRITVKCLCESALALACDELRLPDARGFLTPSTGLGWELMLERLSKRGITMRDVTNG